MPGASPQRPKKRWPNAGTIDPKHPGARGYRISHFSDSFAISAPVEYGEAVFRILSWRSTNLLQAGFLVRGGVTVGQLYHRPKTIFGPALVEAVEIEKGACFPRYLCSETLIEHLDHTSYKNQVIFQDCYENWVVNTSCGSLDLYNDLVQIIEREIPRITKDKDMQKWLYMRKMLSKMYELRSAIDNLQR